MCNRLMAKNKRTPLLTHEFKECPPSTLDVRNRTGHHRSAAFMMLAVECPAMSPMKEASKGAVARALIAVISSYQGFGLTIAVTEQIISSVTTKGAEKSTSILRLT